MKQVPELLRQAVAAFIRYIQSDRLSADRQTTLRQKAEHLADETAKAMGAKDENERLVVWEDSIVWLTDKSKTSD